MDRAVALIGSFLPKRAMQDDMCEHVLTHLAWAILTGKIIFFGLLVIMGERSQNQALGHVIFESVMLIANAPVAYLFNAIGGYAFWRKRVIYEIYICVVVMDLAALGIFYTGHIFGLMFVVTSFLTGIVVVMFLKDPSSEVDRAGYKYAQGMASKQI